MTVLYFFLLNWEYTCGITSLEDLFSSHMQSKELQTKLAKVQTLMV